MTAAKKIVFGNPGFHIVDGKGLAASNMLADPGVYSIVLGVNFRNIHPDHDWGKVIDFKNFASNDGLFLENNAGQPGDLFVQASSATPAVATSGDMTVTQDAVDTTVLTRDASKQVRVYFNGSELSTLAFVDSGDDFVFSGPEGIINLFTPEDGVSQITDAYCSYLAFYDTVLTSAEVSALDISAA